MSVNGEGMQSSFSAVLPCETCAHALDPIGGFNRAKCFLCEVYSDISNPKPTGVLFDNEPCEAYERDETRQQVADAFMMGLEEDGGPGSGNWGHHGRPGHVGGSGKGGGKQYRGGRGDVVAGPTAMVGNNVSEHPKGGASGPSASHTSSPASSAWKTKLSQKKQEVLSGKEADKALFAYESGYADYDEAVAAMNNGTASQLVEQYFEIMERNGDPTPTKPTSKLLDKQFRQEIQEGKHGGDWQQARLDYIRDMTGMDDKEAETTLQQFGTWFGGSWSHADTETLDRYIDEDHAYYGEIYRGMHFEEEEYRRFMQKIKPGSALDMDGHNSSWTTDPEVAWLFSVNGAHHVVITCKNNKTSAPVSHLSMKDEREVLAHSRTQWTVLHVTEGSERTEIVVMEAEKRMSTEERDQKKLQRDSEPTQDQIPLETRMNEQSRFIRVTPPPPDLEEKLRRLGRK